MIKKENKKFIVISLFVVFTLLLAFYLLLNLKFDYFGAKQGDVGIKGDGEIAQMKNKNQEAIDKTAQTSWSEFKGINETDHVFGPDDAAVEIVVYSDYDDDFSMQFRETLKKAKDEFSDSLKIAYRYFPQRQHKNSFKMALAAECGAKQDKFLELHEALFSMKEDNTFDDETLLSTVSDLELDVSTFNKCYVEEEFKDKILKQQSEARSFSIIGTPTTFVNNIILTGATPWEDFVDSAGFSRKGLKSVIEEALGQITNTQI